jgi:hypothetical protein
MELTGETNPSRRIKMKKSLLAIVFAAATLPLTFAQTPAPATQSQPAPDQKSTAAPKKAKKTSKHSTKKSSTSKPAASTTSTPPQK